MQSRSWSLRIVLALAVATTLWAGAASLAEGLLRHAARPSENHRLAGVVSAGAAARAQQPR